MNVRPAHEDEHLTVRRILDAAVLRYGDLDRREVLVAVETGSERAEGGSGRGDDDAAAVETDGDAAEDDVGGLKSGWVLGALVLDGAEIEAVAVRRRRRGQGIGTALVEAAAERRNRLDAEFDAHVCPFYEALGFDVERVEEKRYRGVLERGD
jgi:GNAT superfamily N-acetyltransferase